MFSDAKAIDDAFIEVEAALVEIPPGKAFVEFADGRSEMDFGVVADPELRCWRYDGRCGGLMAGLGSRD